MRRLDRMTITLIIYLNYKI